MSLRSLILLISLLVPTGVVSAQAKPLRLDLNIPAMRLVVYEGDTPIRSYPVSVGMKGHDTPTGRFSISRAEWNPWWRPPAREWAKDDKVTPPGPNNPMGRVKLFFMPYYFIHGTPEAESMGTPASHGCVRMLNRDVIALARLLHQRAAPQVTSKQIDDILSRPSQTRVVGFRNSIPVEIRYEPVVVENGVLKVYPDYYRYGAIHSEAVYQALIAAGYDVQGVSRADVTRLVERGKKATAPISLKVEEAFAGVVPAAPAASTAPGQ